MSVVIPTTMLYPVSLLRSSRAARVFLLAAVVLLACAYAWCAPVAEHQAAAAASAWLASDPTPLGARLGRSIGQIQAFAGDGGTVDYYVAYLDPSGFVIVAADDRLEPILAFSGQGVYDPSDRSPLGCLVRADVRARKSVARVKHGKWARLTGKSVASVGIAGFGSVSDVRVPPFITTRWNQNGVCHDGISYTLACYNYFTPPGTEGTPSNYPSGCVATAMAQLMRYHQHPTTGIGVRSFTIEVDGISRLAYTRGGDGAGGPYDWAAMTNTFGCSSTDTQRRAVGAVCYDAGISVQMSYSAGASGAVGSLVNGALEGTFGYSNAKYGYNFGSNIGAPLSNMANPNLDAGLPVILAINGPAGGHMVVCDGYGYTSSTLYHHLNMGWGGTSDAWYNLPNIDAYYQFNTIHGCVYNVYKTGSGEIFSGRVLDMQGNVIAGAQVTATRGATVYGPVTTNSRGIYAITNLQSSRSYTVQVQHPEYTFSPRSVSTGTSYDNSTSCGNVWLSEFNGVGGPQVASFSINGGAAASTSYVVTLNNVCSGVPTHYMASESSGFTGATWQAYSAAPAFTLSAGNGVKTVYLRVKNAIGTEADLVSDTILVDTTGPTTTASPAAGVYLGSRDVVLTANESGTIYYTTNGLEPTTASAVYSAPIPVAADRTIRFFAVDSLGNAETPKKIAQYWIVPQSGSVYGARSLSDGSPVRLAGKSLYLLQSGSGYIEEPARTSGIRLQGALTGIAGSEVALVGTMTTSLGERLIQVTAMSPSGSLTVKPLGVSNSTLAGWLMTGLYVTTWGMVQPGSVVGNSYVISDGSFGSGVKVLTPAPPAVTPGSFVTVTGAAGLVNGQRVIYTN